ncbi:hypothetical protein BN7_3124 [Wickerhamomyces ciferrii]|uniref:C2 domain-containing protein n=1 Tax=Wickerhamomyces ciferrii (strain ATCC 14091 / BCRC 22168 / CBS 111 / JCM 3599 / NBRC 0793 / NRRL Y-1031 F-60-10) TaxID=1206466 RepID=K0KKP4_WICCF|nr:uncharacterized protein BN7_3124 [Wickerhamomyces ciferrii]CCH43571.1 hypothetical protein BN7_3124 [Wickerhamomyces ciferrii]
MPLKFNSAKGVLVVDPIEARNICTTKSSSKIYCLFQIDNKAFRSKTTQLQEHISPKWNEDSQCRFDIDPGVTPLLKIYILERTSGLPKVLGKGELDLVDIFYEKKVDKWTKVPPTGQINIEYTFYQVAPMLPHKQPTRGPSVPVKNPLPNSPTETVTVNKPKISSVDSVFVDDQKEKTRLRKLASKVKRRYERRISLRETEMEQQLQKMTNDELLVFEVNNSPKDKLNNEEIIHRDEEPEGLEEPEVNVYSIESSKLEELDLNSLPFSADSIGSTVVTKLEKVKAEDQRKKRREAKAAYERLSPSAFAIMNRLEQGRAKRDDFRVDNGVSDYKGDGTWGKGRLSDAVYTEGRPVLPPKIPIGMSSEEYYMLNRKEYLEYFQQIL